MADLRAGDRAGSSLHPKHALLLNRRGVDPDQRAP